MVTIPDRVGLFLFFLLFPIRLHVGSVTLRLNHFSNGCFEDVAHRWFKTIDRVCAFWNLSELKV